MLKSGPEIQNHCSTRAKTRGKPAVILKFGPEIKNRCTQEGLSREKLASIPKFGPEIKNHCSPRAKSREKLASIPKSGPEIKNRCMLRAKSREKFAAIPNSDSRIKNRCSKGHQNILQPKTIGPKPSKFIRERDGLTLGRVERHGAPPLPKLIRKNSRQLSALLRILGRQIVRLPNILPQII